MARERMPPEAQDAWRAYTASADELLAEAAEASTSQSSASVVQGLEQLCRGGLVHFAIFHLKDLVEESLVAGPVRRCWQTVGEDIDFHQELPTEHLAASEASLSVALQEYAQSTAKYSQLLGAFSKQAWRALKLSGLKPSPMLHSLRPEFESFASVALLAAASCDFPGLLQRYYAWKLTQYRQAVAQVLGAKHSACFQDSDVEEVADSDDDSDSAMQPDISEACGSLTQLLSDPQRFGFLHQISQSLRRLHLEDVSSSACEAVVSSAVRQAVDKMTRGKLTESVLGSVQSFVRAVILPFLAVLLGEQAAWEGDPGSAVQRWMQRLAVYTFQTVGRLRAAELFEIVKLFPESLPAVQDLEQCLKASRIHRELVRLFRASCATRLHIPGAKTNDIIDMYVNSIKILRQVDSTGALLEAVSGGTRDYLRSRKDTIRCIVTAMTDDRSEVAGERLFDELQQPAASDDEDEDKEDDAFALQQWQNWEPEPESGDLRNPSRARGMRDIIAMLVQIYGSKDLFINEYRGMLAERLLAKSNFDTDSELRTLEHLKKRFGEANLHDCEVMMKDLADSKRLFNTIRAMPDTVRSPVRGRRQGHNRGIGPVSATIISALFWPQLQKEQLTLPDQIEEHLDEYAAKYWVAKQPRKLMWRKHLGVVELTLSIAGVSKDFAVSPVEAAILMHFQNRTIWSAQELAKEFGSSPEAVARRAAVWVKNGVLVEGQGRDGVCYTRAQSLAAAEGGGPMAVDEDEGSSALVSSEDQAREEMAMYEQYVMGMLTNFEAGLPADRIHNMLKMFVPDQGYDKSAEQLAAFLAQLVADEKLTVSGNIYAKRAP